VTGSEIQLKYTGLSMAGTYCHPFGFEHDEEESAKIVSMINESGADILFIGKRQTNLTKYTINGGN